MYADKMKALELATLNRQMALQDAIEGGQSDVQKFYNDATVLVTGATGFIGKQLVEKLIRSVPNIKKVYILARPKKGKSTQERLAAYILEPVFDLVRKTCPDFAKKIIMLEGDVAELNLGMSEVDRNTVIEEVKVIFNLAATTRFNEPLKKNILTNVRATREVLTLALKCKKLLAFVHTSTAYAHCYMSSIEEKFYESPIPYKLLIELAETINETKLDSMAPDFIKPWPNTYSFSKAVAEEVIRDMGAELPVAIIRPSIVVPTYYEPEPGWLDVSNVFGASGILVGSGLGVMHSFYADKSCSLDIVPVDYVNNAAIAVAIKAADRIADKPREPKIYSCTTSKRNSATWEIMIGSTKKLQWINSPKAIWYTFNSLQYYKYIHYLLITLYHFIPALLVDTVLVVIGKKPILFKVYTKIQDLNEVLSYFTFNKFLFDDKNTEALYESLSNVDKQIYNFDVSTIDYEEYVRNWAIGTRKFILKDGLKAPDSRQTYFRIGHYIMTALYIYLFWKLLWLSCYIIMGVVSLIKLIPT